MEYTKLGNTNIEISKLCIGCISFGKAGTMYDWTLDKSQSKTDRVAKGKYDRMEQQDILIVQRVHELAEKYQYKMSQIAIAWQWAKGIASPIIGDTKTQYLDDAVGALNISLTSEDIDYHEELYVPHPIVGAIDKNTEQGVMLLDEKK